MSADRELTMTCQGAPAHPLEDDNILTMILCRLPALPSSLPRVSPVCKRWRRLVTDPYFHRTFLAHHKKAPLLGLFFGFNGRIGFRSVLDPPNRIIGPRFSCNLQLGEGCIILACHHGRLLALNYRYAHFVVWDPITRDHCHIEIPQVFKQNGVSLWNGAAVCASQEKGHIHGACHKDPFQVVLIGSNSKGVFACVYSSDAGTWGSLISLPRQMPDSITIHLTVPADCQSSLVGNSIYWLPVGIMGAAVEFDLHKQNLAVIDPPPDALKFDASSIQHEQQPFIMPADGGGLSFIVLSGFSVHVWKRISNGHGVAGWVFKNTVELSSFLSLKPSPDMVDIQGALRIVGLDEDGNVIFRFRGKGTIYIIHLETLQFKKISPQLGDWASYPFSSFYTAGMHAETGMRGDGNVNSA